MLTGPAANIGKAFQRQFHISVACQVGQELIYFGRLTRGKDSAIKSEVERHGIVHIKFTVTCQRLVEGRRLRSFSSEKFVNDHTRSQPEPPLESAVEN